MYSIIKMKKQVIVSLVGVLVLIISFWFDKRTISLIGLIKNRYLDYFFGAVTNFWSIVIALITINIIFLWKKHKRKWFPILLASFLTTFAITTFLKIVIARPRPFNLIILSFLGTIDYSFPSLHTAILFAPIVILNRKFPMFKWFWMFFAFIVGFSRLYLNMHYLSDVIGGVLLGYVVGYFFVKYKSVRNFESGNWKNSCDKKGPFYR